MESWLDFIARIVESMVWPALLAFFVLYFRRQIIELLKEMKTFKSGGVEIEFGRKLEEVKVAMEAAEDDRQKGTPGREQSKLLSQQYQDHIVDLLVDSRALAIQEAWSEVETAARNALSHLQVDSDHLSQSQMLQALSRNKLLGPRQLKIFVQLRDLRNRAVQLGDSAISDSNALAFADLAIQLAAVLEGGATPAENAVR